MRLLLFLTVLLVIDLYAFQAFRTVYHSWPRFSRMTMLVIYGALSFGAYLYVIGSSNHAFDHWNQTVTIYLRAFVFILFLSKFFVAIFMGIDDLRRLFFWVTGLFSAESTTALGRSKFLSQLGLIIGAIPFVSLTYGMVRNPYRYKLHRHTVSIPGLPESLEGLRIVQISDIHSGSFTFKEPIKNGIDMINQLNPDLVFFTGDLVNTHSAEMSPYLDVFDKIKSRFGIFSILGNHDYGDYKSWPTHQDKKENFDTLKLMHEKMGWDLLLNETRMLQIHGANLAVIGVENISGLKRFKTYGDMEVASKGSQGADLKILLSHDPTHWSTEVKSSYKDIDLTLSGHTHGFQFGIEIPGWIKWSPSKYIYPHWAGLYEHEGQHLYVNRGFGVLGYPGRVGILPEITLLELKSTA